MRFPSRAATFLRDLQRNNDRDWFAANKPRYELARTEVEAFAKTIFAGVAAHDALEPKQKYIGRIYRDTRFSKDKTPYKPFMSGGFDRLGSERRGGYYWHVEPGGLRYFPEFADDSAGEAFAGGGFWQPEADDLKRIREELAADHAHFREVLARPPVGEAFDGLYPVSVLKTAPRDYPKDHPAIDLLKHKGFVLVRQFSKRETAADTFSDALIGTLVSMRPFLDYMSHVLTTDANGEPLRR